MSTTIRRLNGGYHTLPNRWIDAGYMAAAPGSVTQVYMFLCRWADNTTLQSAQPMRLIAQKCGISEDVARKAIRALERWGVIVRDPGSGRSAKNIWTLNDLPDHAPEYPDKKGPKQSGGPQQTAPPQSKGPYQPESINELDKSSSGTVPDKTEGKPLPENGPAQKIVKAYCGVMGIPKPTNYGKSVGQAQMLVDVGITPEEIPRLIAWLRQDAFWAKAGIDLGTCVSAAEKWQGRKQKRPDDDWLVL